MSDIIEELRGAAFVLPREKCIPEAADEIERLREVLDRIQNEILDHIEAYRKPDIYVLMRWRREACEALGKTGLRAPSGGGREK